MTAAELDALEAPEIESDSIRCWRFEQLVRAASMTRTRPKSPFTSTSICTTPPG